jgi:hypothetical protein
MSKRISTVVFRTRAANYNVIFIPNLRFGSLTFQMRFTNRHWYNGCLTSYYNALVLFVCLCLIYETFCMNEQRNKKRYEMLRNWLYIFCTVTQVTKTHQSDTVNWTDGRIFLQFSVFYIEGIFMLLQWSISTLLKCAYYCGVHLLVHCVSVNDGKIVSTINLSYIGISVVSFWQLVIPAEIRHAY